MGFVIGENWVEGDVVVVVGVVVVAVTLLLMMGEADGGDDPEGWVVDLGVARGWTLCLLSLFFP